MARPGTYLRSAEAARRLGVSVKALRIFETHGLIQAERTMAGWRVYGPDHIRRLHQIIALKTFGFPLSRIGELLSGRLPDLATFLVVHEQLLQAEAQRIDRAIRLVSAAQAKLAVSGDLSPDDLMNLTKETTMSDPSSKDLASAYDAIAAKHFSAADQQTLSANGYGGMAAFDPDWVALGEQAARLMQTGDPHSPEAMDLAKRWMTKVFAVTGGDRALTMKMKAVARETHATPAFAAAAPGSNAIMDFVAQAYGAAIAAGIMPNPASPD